MASVTSINSTTREKVAALMPLVDRLHRGHCWRKAPDGGMDCIKEPLDDFKIAEHVSGRKTYGVCPIIPGESTTRAALLDFDSHKGETPWPVMLEVASDVAFALQQEGYTPILFRSSGGRGVHLYLLWDSHQDAYSVREMLAEVISSLGFKSGSGGVSKAQIEIFPKQNEVDTGKFGSMWVLPYAGQSEPIGEFIGWVDSLSVPHREQPPKAERAPCTTPALNHLREALAAIPNDDLDYDQWRNVGFAVHEATEGSDEGLDLFHEFSARSPKHDPDFLDNRFWPYAGRSTGDLVPADYVFNLASRCGWQDPTVIDDFDVIEAQAADDFEALPTEAGDKADRFRVLNEDEFLIAKPVSWLIKNVIPHAELGVMYGESASGKSFMALDIAAAVALGTAWRGRRVKQGRVVYIAAEGAGGFRNRMKAYRLHNELEHTGVQIIASAPNLIEKADALAICKSILVGGPADLVIVDTLAQSMQGNENSGEDMGRVLAHCKGIHRATGAMVLLIHHSGKDAARGARGWSGLRAACDAELEVVRCDEDRVLTVTKQKDGEDGAEFGFKLEVVPIDMDEDGDVISSCVIEHGDVVRRVKVKGANQKHAMDAFSDLEGLAQDGNGVEREEWIRASILLLDAPENGKVDRRRDTVIRAIESMREAGLFIVEGSRFRRKEA